MALLLEVYGSTKSKRELINSHTNNIIDILFKEEIYSELDIILTKSIDADGYCSGIWLGNSFICEINIDSSLNNDELIKTLAHELYHFKQRYTNKLKYINNKVIFFHEDVEYTYFDVDITTQLHIDFLWEKEAKEFEEIYFKQIKSDR